MILLFKKVKTMKDIYIKTTLFTPVHNDSVFSQADLPHILMLLKWTHLEVRT